MFLHLIHPFTLRNLRSALGDVKGFYDQLVKLNPGAENVQIAKSTFLDVVSSSGINLNELDSVLAQIPDEIKQFDGTRYFISTPGTSTTQPTGCLSFYLLHSKGAAEQSLPVSAITGIFLASRHHRNKAHLLRSHRQTPPFHQSHRPRHRCR